MRSVARPDDRARVIFLVARISDDGSLVQNINARYTVESVEISGIPEADISRALRDRLQALVGRRLDHDEADELIRQLEAERTGLPSNDASSAYRARPYPRRLRVQREGRHAVDSLHAEPIEVRLPPDQGWSGALDIPMGGRSHRVTAGFAFDNNDDLVEEYSGVSLAFAGRRDRPTWREGGGRLVQQHLARTDTGCACRQPGHP